MNTVVNKLLDVDKEARQILDEAQQYYDNTMREIAGEKQKITDEYEQKAKTHLDIISETESKNVQDAAREIGERYGKLSGGINRMFAENHEKWEDELYKKCIGR